MASECRALMFSHYSDIIMTAMASQIINRLNYLLNRLFRCRSKKTSKIRITGLCEGNPLVTGWFPSQRASNTKNDVVLHVDLSRSSTGPIYTGPIQTRMRSFDVFVAVSLKLSTEQSSWQWSHTSWHSCDITAIYCVLYRPRLGIVLIQCTLDICSPFN